MTEEVWQAQMAHDLKTMFLASKHVLPVMEKQVSGAIINLSSIAGLRMSAERAHVAYSTAKFGILAFSKSSAMRFARRSLQYRDPGPHEHAARRASAAQDHCGR
jgi:NAD(P)-dependent dehydrogenase (short-subunit alcohol dehydrogenase family)